MSAIGTRTPGKHPKENILRLTHSERLKSRNLLYTRRLLCILTDCHGITTQDNEEYHLVHRQQLVPLTTNLSTVVLTKFTGR
jgi:hypothetical protein